MSNTISHRSPECKPLLMYKQSGATAIMSIKGPKAPAEHVRAQPSDEEEEQAKDWVAWGTSDDFPETVAKLIRKYTVGRAGLQRLTTYLYGQRTVTYQVVDYDENGREIIQVVKLPAWELLKRHSNYKSVSMDPATDSAYFAIPLSSN